MRHFLNGFGHFKYLSLLLKLLPVMQINIFQVNR